MKGRYLRVSPFLLMGIAGGDELYDIAHMLPVMLLSVVAGPTDRYILAAKSHCEMLADQNQPQRTQSVGLALRPLRPLRFNIGERLFTNYDGSEHKSANLRKVSVERCRSVENEFLDSKSE